MNLDSEAISRLYEWFHVNSGILQEGVTISYSTSHGYHLRAQDKFDSSKPIIHVPQSLTISVHAMSRTQSHWPKEFLNHYIDNPYVVTRFLLMDEHLHGISSWWYPYISLLPQLPTSQANSINTPVWFSDEDLEWLQGTSLHTATQARIESWQREYKIGSSYLSDLKNFKEYSWPLYKWAATILSSRCFPSRRIERQANAITTLSTSTIDDAHNKISMPVLVPVLDLANHDPRSKVTWVIDENGYALYTSGRTEVGGEIFNNYGQKGNEELLMGYGFTIPNNPADHLGIKFPIRESPQKHCARGMIKDGKTFALHINLAQLNVEESPVSEFVSTSNDFHLQYGMELSETLFDTVRLTCINEREMKEIFLGRDSASQRLINQSRGQLLLAFIHRREMLQTSKALSGSKASNVRQDMAREYVRGQSQILDYHIIKLLHDLHEVRKSVNVWTLEDILQDGPSLVKQAIRKLSRAVCNTRDAQKLRGKGLEDSFMVITICLVSLTSPTNSTSTHHMETDTDDAGVLKAFEAWHRFIGSTYCVPPDSTGECQGTNCFCNTHVTRPWSTAPTDYDSEINVAQAIVQRYFLVCDPEPSFGSPDHWTKSFLRWGYGIWHAEAVFLPLETVARTTIDLETGWAKGLYLENPPSSWPADVS